jgi:Rieske Fe-S protein
MNSRCRRDIEVMSESIYSSRRQFLKTFAFFSASSWMAGREWSASVLAEIQQEAGPQSGKVVVKVSDFPALAADFGSVRLGTSSLRNNLPIGFLFPILINRGPNNQFYALNSECTHAGCAVRPYSRTTGACVCPCHDSRFAIDGARTRGPASFELQSFPIRFDGTNTLEIDLPDFPLAVVAQVSPEAPGTMSRMRLEFHAFSNLEYEVQFRETMASPWTRVPFSTTAAGPATATVFAGKGVPSEVFVDRTTESGFYAIAIRVKAV